MELHHQATVPQSPKLKHLFCRVALANFKIESVGWSEQKSAFAKVTFGFGR
jgi:hypothetical protein